MTSFRWLHLSDFHLGMKRHADLWPNMEAAFFDDLSATLKDSDSLDLVLFTGDLVQKGDALEYQELEIWLQKLWDRFSNLNPPRLLAIPGNHDLLRPATTGAVSLALRHNWSRNEVHNTFWNDPDSEYRKLVDHAFANYLTWWQTTKIPKPEQFVPGLLPGDFSASIKKDQYQLGIIGLKVPSVTLRTKMLRKILA